MTEWGVFLVLVAVVGFLGAVIPPITKLTKAITELTVVVNVLKNDVEDLKKRNDEKHTRLQEHINEQAAKIIDLETRILLMEKAG